MYLPDATTWLLCQLSSHVGEAVMLAARTDDLAR